MLTVHDLRKRGFKVRVWHDRCYREKGMFGGLTLQSKGGATEVLVTLPDEVGVRTASAVGIAECSPKDNFDRKRGVRIALGRALKQLGLCTK